MREQAIEIVFQDANILVVNKPAGLSVTADRTGQPVLIPTLQRQLRGGENLQLRLVHRLDKDASGLLILAKNPNAQ
jgi:23S rRNA-/tRNA-specific pseudouridylate synthase